MPDMAEIRQVHESVRHLDNVLEVYLFLLLDPLVLRLYPPTLLWDPLTRTQDLLRLAWQLPGGSLRFMTL
ncbi:unnamed protein product [Gadus morhua 'NCC']